MPTFKRSLVLIVASVLIGVLAFGRPDRSRDAEFSRDGLPLLTAVDELSYTEMLAMGLIRTDWVVNVRDSGAVFLAAGADPITAYFTVENGGEHADNYAISSWSDGLDLIDRSGLPAEIALAPGESRELAIEVAVPAGTAGGVLKILWVAAESTINGIASGLGGAAVVVSSQ